jgi:outer membrane receptor protein involved in Fe transport
VHRTGFYDYFFPSASVKWKFAGNLDFHLGYSRTIRRPTFANVAGVWAINDTNLTVSLPNPSLRPELSNNVSTRLAYYFEPVGIVGLNFFQNTVDGLHLTKRMTAQEFGYSGELENYAFITTDNSANKRVIRGMELEYSQSLSFLPRSFKGLNIRAAYTRNYSQGITAGMAPHLATAGLNYSLGRVNAYTRVRWSDDAPNSSTGLVYYRHRTEVDVGGGCRFTGNLSFFFTATNLFNAPLNLMRRIDPAPPASTLYQMIGTTWTFGVKGVF